LKPEDNLELARFLSGPPRGVPEEASLRGASGRAYYAAFIFARDLLLGAGFWLPRDGKVHKAVVALLKLSVDDDIRGAAAALERLREFRNKADYALGLRASAKTRFDTTQTRLAVVAAISIIEQLRRTRREDRRLRIPLN
jgi:uncharacterized protein (UPF0332 family)